MKVTEVLDLGEGQSPILSLLTQAVWETDVFKLLKGVNTIISALDPKVAEITKAKEMQRYIYTEIYGYSDDKESPEYRQKLEFLRKLKLHSKVAEMPETAIEYYGQDFLTHPEFHFDQEFESKLKTLQLKFDRFIGKCIKEYSKGEELEL